MSLFTGSGAAIVTPFKDGKIDYRAFEKLLNWHVDNKTDAIIVCGTTGEASTLSSIEKISLTEFAVKTINGRIPVIAGSGSNNTSQSIYLSKELQYVGADGLLIVTPYYNKATKAGLIKHYRTIAENTTLPVIMYSVKSRTGVNITPDIVSELYKIENIIGIKEASGDISQIAKICAIADQAKAEGIAFDVYSGNDDHTLPVLSLGGIGCISTVANIIPLDFHNMIDNYMSGKRNEAMKLQLKMLPLIEAMFMEVNPVPVKAALNMMGFIEKEYRMPMCEPENQTLYKIYEEMRNYGIKMP